MKKKNLLIIVIILIVLIALPFIIKGYNSIAEEQRESIKYCEVDEDCALKEYTRNPCGEWISCFNKGEKPISDIKIGVAMCDYPATGCKCEEGRCLSCVLENCQ
ncbi:MAG: hypothetical protein ABIE94_02955 [archaeon]